MRLSHMFVVGFGLCVATTASGQMGGTSSAAPAEKIRNAMAAGPASVTADATIMDWPAVKGGASTQLRAGTNGWICYPRSSKTIDNAMCLDPVFQQWMSAIRTKTAPRITRIGLAYLLAGGFIGSAHDPFSTGPTDTNDWGRDGPMIMVISPDPSLYAGLPTRRSTGPYVMYAGTPYAHIMVPVRSTMPASMLPGAMPPR